jgi:hypothetical protein
MPTTTEAASLQSPGQEGEAGKAIGNRVESLISAHPTNRADAAAALRSSLDDRSAAIVVWDELLRTRKIGSGTHAMAGICALSETLYSKDKKCKVGQEQCCLILGRLCCSRSKAAVIAKAKRCKFVSGLMQALSSEEICQHAKQAASWALRRLTEVSNKMRTDLCLSREFLAAAARIISGHPQPSSLYFKPAMHNGSHSSSMIFGHATPSSSRRSSTFTSPAMHPEDMNNTARQHRKFPPLDEEHATNGEAPTLSPHVISRRLSMPDFSPVRANSHKSAGDAVMLPQLVQRSRSHSVAVHNDMDMPAPVRTLSHGSAYSSMRSTPTCSPTLTHSNTAPMAGMLPPLSSSYDDASYSSMPAGGKHAHERRAHRGHLDGEMSVCMCVCMCCIEVRWWDECVVCACACIEVK